jgi:hypothetical protein
MKWLFAFLLALCVCCAKDDKDVPRAVGDPKYQELVEQFANAIAQKDYRTAYDLTSANLRDKLTFDEFIQTWKPYLDSFESDIQTGYEASGDPQEMAEFVPEADRPHLVEEITIEFSGNIGGSEEAFFCTVWVIDDGTPSIGSFYVED